MSDWSSKNPYMAELTVNYALTSEYSNKETRHFSVALGDSGLEYKAGDALAVIPHNPPELVADLLALLGFSGEETVETHLGEQEVGHALLHTYEIHRLNKKFIKGLNPKLDSSARPVEVRLVGRSRAAVSSGEATQQWLWSGEDEDFPADFHPVGSALDPAYTLWSSLVEDAEAMENYIWSRDYIDLLGDFPHLLFTPLEFVSGLDRLKPRLYSIASSPDAHPGEVELTVAIVRYEHHDRARGGLCTVYLADHTELNTRDIPVFMSPTRSFVLPEDGDVDIIMVGPGTGIAPFRAYLEQREIDGAKGHNWLFFGDRTEKGEFLYREQLQHWVKTGHLTQLDLAWSREPDKPKVYVQHLMKKHAAEIWVWLEGGAYFYVCGDKNYMAKDVHQTLIDIVEEHGEMSADDAKQFVEVGMMKEEKRYLRDVY
jgi:sulfite reductase (NADPH) flavoprotein alpha-component